MHLAPAKKPFKGWPRQFVDLMRAETQAGHSSELHTPRAFVRTIYDSQWKPHTWVGLSRAVGPVQPAAAMCFRCMKRACRKKQKMESMWIPIASAMRATISRIAGLAYCGRKTAMNPDRKIS